MKAYRRMTQTSLREMDGHNTGEAVIAVQEQKHSYGEPVLAQQIDQI